MPETEPPSRRSRVVHALVVSALVFLAVAAVALDLRRRDAKARLERAAGQVESLSGADDQETAGLVVSRVRELIDLPADAEPTVARITDVEALRRQSPFYARASDGDFLILTPDRAVLYSPSSDRIIDVVPVQTPPASPPTP